MMDSELNMAHRNPCAEPLDPHSQHPPMGVFRASDSETMTQELTQLVDFYAFKREGDPGQTIEEFLQADPFGEIPTSADPETSVVYELLGDDEDTDDILKFLDLGDSDLFHVIEPPRIGDKTSQGSYSPSSRVLSISTLKQVQTEQVSPLPHVLPTHTFTQTERPSPYIGGNALTPSFLVAGKFEHFSSSPDTLSLSMTQAMKKEHSSPSPPSRLQKLKFPSVGKFTMPPKMKLLRKLKSFTTSTHHNALAGPTFSLEECLSEFHIGEGNYAFQDETARFSTQLGPMFQSPISKRKLSAKLPKTLAKPELRKVKTSSNLCLQNVTSSSKVLKNMESGLMSFQLNLNNAPE